MGRGKKSRTRQEKWRESWKKRIAGLTCFTLKMVGRLKDVFSK